MIGERLSTGTFEDRVLASLQTAGIDFPTHPSNKPQPLPWLIRGEQQDARLLGRESDFLPHAGQYETYGVFLGDNLKALMPGIMYVFPTNNVAREWLVVDSPEMNLRIANIAQQASPPLRLETIGGYSTAAQEVYKRSPVYDPRSGCATTPYALQVAAAELILVQLQLLDINRDRIPPHLRNKVLAY